MWRGRELRAFCVIPFPWHTGADGTLLAFSLTFCHLSQGSAFRAETEVRRRVGKYDGKIDAAHLQGELTSLKVGVSVVC